MSESYDLLRRIVENATAAVAAEAALAAPGPSNPTDDPLRIGWGPPDPTAKARHRAEKDFATAAFRCRQDLAEYNGLPRFAGFHGGPLPVVKAIRRLDRILKARLAPWGLDDEHGLAIGPAFVQARYIERRDALINPLIDAAASWRPNDDDADDDDLADGFAGMAKMYRIEPTMTPDAGRHAYPSRLRAWRESPLLDGEPVADDDDARRELRETVAVLRSYFDSLLTPDGIARIEERAASMLRDLKPSADEPDGRPLPVAPVEPPPAPAAKRKGGRKPEPFSVADQEILDAWATGDCTTYKKLAAEKKVSPKYVERLVKRQHMQRSRKASAGGRASKPTHELG